MALKEILAVSAWLFQEGADPVVKDRAAFFFLSSCSSHVAMRDVALASHFVFIEWGSFLTSDEVAWGSRCRNTLCRSDDGNFVTRPRAPLGLAPTDESSQYENCPP